MTEHRPVTDSFHHFYRLANELQLMIWEYTWPDSRVIEAALFENPEGQKEESAEPFEIVNLRLAGKLSTLLEQGLECRVTEQSPVEKCADPVALQVCRQSRMHTLRRYRLMQSLARPFYYHPQRDIFYLTVDVADDYPIHMPFLKRHHGPELDCLETILIMEGAWPTTEAENRLIMGYALKYISHLGGLQTIQILSFSEESTGDGNSEEAGIVALAERLRSTFPSLVQESKCTAKKLEVMDCEGNLY